MVVLALLIINKAGGLIYNREFHAGLAKIDTNDLLVIASTFHGIHAITQQICPVPPLPHTSLLSSSFTPNAPTGPVFTPQPTGLQVLETSTFFLHCFQTISGTKFLLFTEPSSSQTFMSNSNPLIQSHQSSSGFMGLGSNITSSSTSHSSSNASTFSSATNVDQILRRICELYADYVMKNPFYTLEMPIRCDKFDRHLDQFARSVR